MATERKSSSDCDVYEQSFSVSYDYPVYFARSVFDKKSDLSLHENRLGSPDFAAIAPEGHASAFADTVEVYDIEITEEEDRNMYKEVAIYVLVAAAVGYFVYTLIKPDDDEAADSGGKEPPITPSITFSIPLTR